LGVAAIARSPSTSSGSTTDARPTADASVLDSPLRSIDGMATRGRGKPRVVPPTTIVEGQRGAIMRGRNRSPVWPPRRTPLDVRRRQAGTNGEADVQIEGALYALARLLARQAAREMFERTRTSVDGDRRCDEGQQ
jgi:hypothetical protein